MITAWLFQLLLHITCVLYALCTTDISLVNGTEIELMNCSLVPKFPAQREQIAGFASGGKTLIKITVKINGGRGPLNETYPDSVYTPNHWVISTSITGKSMLILKEYFSEMSITTLGTGVAKASLDLVQSPENCLKGVDVDDIENILRTGFLNNFKAEDKKLPIGSEICNAHVVSTTNTEGKVAYVCCNKSPTGDVQCSQLKEGIWLEVLLTSILILQIIIILYSPLLLPEAVYNENSLFEKFIFETESAEANSMLKFNVKKLDSCSMVDPGFVKTKQQSFTELVSLKDHIESLKPNTVYTMYSNKVEIRVKFSKLIALGSAPVTFLGFIKYFFVRCKIRDEVPEFGECCNASMFPCKSKSRVCPWYGCLQYLMMLVVVTLISLPWLLRIWFYYNVEEEPIQRMRQALSEKNLNAPYTGNLVSYLSPVHPLFLVIYIVIGIEILLYPLMTDNVKRKVKFIAQKCLRDMNDSRKNKFGGIIMSRFLWPFRRFGLAGCIIFPVWCIVLPLFVLLFSLELFPMLNLSVRLLTNFFYHLFHTIKQPLLKKKEIQMRGKVSSWFWQRVSSLLIVENKNDVAESSRLNAIIYACSGILTLLTMILSLIIVFECISFYVECAVYTLVGFILNSNDTVKYLSFIFLITVYANECFSSVRNSYCVFSRAISSDVQAMVGESMEKEASKPDNKQENTAFRTPAKPNVQEQLTFVSGRENYLKVNLSRLVLFLDKYDVLFIPKSFLFQMAQLPHPLCPGKVHRLYIKAIRDFSVILIFLFFVFIVIFAFGQAHDISSAGQVIVALGSGFLPLVFRKFLFQPQEVSGLDKSNLKWKFMFADKIQEYAQSWNLQEIHITDTKEAEFVDTFPDNSEINHEKESSDHLDLIIQLQSDDTYSYYVPAIYGEHPLYKSDAESML